MDITDVEHIQQNRLVKSKIKTRGNMKTFDRKHSESFLNLLLAIGY